MQLLEEKKRCASPLIASTEEKTELHKRFANSGTGGGTVSQWKLLYLPEGKVDGANLWKF